MASSTSCLMPLPSNTASCEAPASKTALNPKVASCLAVFTWGRWGWWVFFFLGGVHGSRTPWGGRTYVDGAVAQAVHHPPVPSARLGAGQRPDPNVGGHRGGTVWGPPLRPWTR